MSEKTYTHHSHEREKQDHELKDHGHEELDKLLNEKARDAKNEHAEQIDELRQETKAEALPAATLLEKQVKDDEPDGAPAMVNHELKDMKYKRTLQSVSKNLSAPEKALSKVIHNPVVDMLSEGAEKTIARPSGLLAGSVCALIGSSTFLYIAKHYGYEYNFLMFVMFFVGGFFIGLIIELALRVVKKPH